MSETVGWLILAGCFLVDGLVIAFLLAYGGKSPWDV